MRVIDLPPRAGLAWIKISFTLFRAQPIGWISLVSVWLLASLGLSLVPLAGPALMGILQPGFFGGFVIAARDQEAGLPVGAHQLFAAFRANGRALATIGSITLLANLLVVVMLGLLGFPLNIARDAEGIPDMRAYAQSLEGSEWMLWLGIVLTMAIKGALWFTAAILALNQMPATHAIRWSCYAFIANFLPMLVLLVAMTAIFFLALLPLMLGLLVATPLFAIVHYASYRDMFRPSEEG